MAGVPGDGGGGRPPWGLGSDARAPGRQLVSIGSPWRAVRSACTCGCASARDARDLVRAGAIVLAVLLLSLFTRPCSAWPVGAGPVTRPLGPAAAATGSARERQARERQAREPAAVGRSDGAGRGSLFVFGFAWLAAWPYVLPWYDGLAWALLALLPWTSLPWAALDWLVLARTAALAFGYLPARGITLPAGVGWLRSVVRTG